VSIAMSARWSAHLLLLAALASIAACRQGVEAPTDTGVCYHLAAIANGQPKFNMLATNVPDMEHCAAKLEVMRIHFLSLGGSTHDVVGAYQGNFLFLGDDGVFASESYDGPRYPFLVRSGDRLVPVGSAR
jgi:hypothetical protein